MLMTSPQAYRLQEGRKRTRQGAYGKPLPYMAEVGGAR